MTIHTKTVPPRSYACIADDVTQPEIAPFAQRAIGPLYEAIKAAGLEIAGDLEAICEKWNDQGKSRVMFAVPVQAEKPIAAPYFFWRSSPFKCAWAEYVGEMPGLKAAWAAFGPAVAAAGYKPTAARSWREVYKHWESFHSDKNVTELQLGID